MKGWYKALEDLVWLTQLGLNMLLPLVMCLGGAWWAVNSWSWPEWVFLPAILLGLAAGAPGPRQKGKTEAGGVQLTSVNITGGSPL